jgi:ADP-ribosylglycohydrolase
MDRMIRSRVRGAIVGTAIGDALGMPVEGLNPETIAEKHGLIRSMVSPKDGTWAREHHNLKRGQWTDDTQLMFAIGESMANKRHIDFRDIARRHITEMKNDPRGWGGSTMSGIGKIAAGVNWWNSGKVNGAGNGIAMKIAPIGVIYGLGGISSFDMASTVLNISRMTHADSRAAIAGILQAELISAAIKSGLSGLQSALWNTGYSVVWWEKCLGTEVPSLSKAIIKALSVTNGVDFISFLRSAVGTGCFVVESFPFTCAAVRALGSDPEKCLIEIVNQGGDADTTGAMAGALLGAAHGLSSLPRRWRTSLEGYQRLIQLADSLCDLGDMKEDSFGHERPKIRFKYHGSKYHGGS